MTRAPQRRPLRRPKSASIAFSRASKADGASSLSISTAALAKRLDEGPSGALATIGEVAMVSPNAATAARTSAAGAPWRPRRLEPIPIA